MKVNKLLIRNINSLAGDHVIDFDEINDRSEGVYLIVGATGSGKTTILDAITLGLYGAVKRLGDISAGNIEKTGSIITHGSKDARVDVIFSAKGRKYTVRWQIRHKVRSAGWEAAQMSLFDEQNQLLESGLNPVRKRIVEIIGMSFDQFNKAILLAQGDFASFLKSKFSDKADILEKITGTENYSKIGKAIFDRHNMLKANFEQIQNDFNSLSLKTEDEILELNDKINLLNISINKNINRSEELNQLINNRKNHEKEKARLVIIEGKLTAEKESLSILMQTYDVTINSYDAAITIRPSYDNYKKLNQEQPELLTNKKNLEQDKAEILSRQAEIFQKASEIIKPEEDEELFVSSLSEFKDKIITLENELNAVRITSENVKSNLKKELNRLKNDEFNQLLNNSLADELKTQLTLSAAALKTEMSVLQNYFEITEVREEFIDKYNLDLKEAEYLQSLRLRYIQVVSDIKLRNEQLIKNETDIDQLIQSIHVNTKVLSSAESLYKDKETILNQQIKIKSLESHRAHLIAGEDCPLCGAADGPLRHAVIPDADIYREQFEIAKKDFEKVKTALVIEKTQLTGLNTIIEKLKSEIIVQNTQKDEIAGEINEKKSKLGISESLSSPKILEDKISKINGDILQLKKLVKYSELLPIYEQAIVLSDELVSSLLIEKNKSAELKNQFPLEIQVKIWADNLINDYEKNQKLLRQNQIEYSGNETLLVKNKHQINLLLQEIQEFVVDNKLSSLENVEYLFSQQINVTKWKNSILELQQNILSNESLFHSTFERIRELEEKVDLTVDASIFEQEKAGLSELVKTESETLGSLKSVITAHDLNFLKGETLNRALDENETLWDPVRILNNLIGSATGHEFKKIAQKITLSHLAVLANKHLSLMNDRYKFRFDTKELWSKEDADLMIFDAYDPEGLRSCATLSGGETFIASLALALGLSDFASENNKIESLFIDEGFGTLDPDTLEMAISALERIQIAGKKTLCLITHVEAMKERIPYHLVIEKGRQGISTIRHEMM